MVVVIFDFVFIVDAVFLFDFVYLFDVGALAALKKIRYIFYYIPCRLNQ